MGWFKTKFKSSFFDLFTTSSPAHLESAPEVVTIEDIRREMLALMNGIDAPALTRRVTYSLDVQALWYMRGDLLGMLATRHGEAAAFEMVDSLTPMFRGALPQGLVARHSPLSAQGRRHAGDSDFVEH